MSDIIYNNNKIDRERNKIIIQNQHTILFCLYQTRSYIFIGLCHFLCFGVLGLPELWFLLQLFSVLNIVFNATKIYLDGWMETNFYQQKKGSLNKIFWIELNLTHVLTNNILRYHTKYKWASECFLTSSEWVLFNTTWISVCLSTDMLDDEKRHLDTLERKVKKTRGLSSDAEDISEELDVSWYNSFLYKPQLTDFWQSLP